MTRAPVLFISHGAPTFAIAIAPKAVQRARASFTTSR